MHPEVIQEEPGNCPLCGMKLTPVRTGGGTMSGGSTAAGGGEREIAYWVAPMDPSFVSDKPGKSPMGMDLVPVYKGDLNTGVVRIDPVTLQSIGVKTEIARRRDLAREVRSNGTVAYPEDAEVRVNSKISGWVEHLYVDRTGDPVEAGQPLLDIYSPELVAAQEEYLLALENAEALAGGGLERVAESGRKLLAAARRRLELWDISTGQIDSLEKNRQVRRTMTLYSPAGGIILHKNVVEGAAVKPGMDLFTIVDLDTVWVLAQIYEFELPWVRVGDPTEVKSPYDPDYGSRGRVEYVYPTLDAKTRSVQVRIVLPNPGLQLRPDMVVDARIASNPRRSVLAVSKEAVVRSGERDLVFVSLGEGRFEPREVRLGVESSRYYQVERGLNEGESVVTSAQFLLDSEANLQEAIQRRLRKRMVLASEGGAGGETGN